MRSKGRSQSDSHNPRSAIFWTNLRRGWCGCYRRGQANSSRWRNRPLSNLDPFVVGSNPTNVLRSIGTSTGVTPLDLHISPTAVALTGWLKVWLWLRHFRGRDALRNGGRLPDAILVDQRIAAKRIVPPAPQYQGRQTENRHQSLLRLVHHVTPIKIRKTVRSHDVPVSARTPSPKKSRWLQQPLTRRELPADNPRP